MIYHVYRCYDICNDYNRNNNIESCDCVRVPGSEDGEYKEDGTYNHIPTAFIRVIFRGSSMLPSLQPKGKKKGKGKGKGKGKAAKAPAVIDGISVDDMTKEQVGKCMVQC